jgi:hypothetical protein
VTSLAQRVRQGRRQLSVEEEIHWSATSTTGWSTWAAA